MLSGAALINKRFSRFLLDMAVFGTGTAFAVEVVFDIEFSQMACGKYWVQENEEPALKSKIICERVAKVMVNSNESKKRRKNLASRRKFIAATALAGVGAHVTSAAKRVNAVTRTGQGKRYGMVIDLRRCVGCHACTVACKSEFNVPLGVWRAWVKVKERGTYPETERSFLPKLCNNCRNAPCVKACPTGASHYDKDEVVQINDKKCIGCKLCVAACPYKQRFINPDKNRADKCSLCMHRVRKGLVPSCVNTCVGRARIFGDFNDPDSEVSMLVKANRFTVLKPELGTRPQVYYIGGDVGE